MSCFPPSQVADRCDRADVGSWSECGVQAANLSDACIIPSPPDKAPTQTFPTSILAVQREYGDSSSREGSENQAGKNTKTSSI